MLIIKKVAYILWQFIILGFVPGTDIQITFSLLAQIAGIAGFVYLVWLAKKEEKFFKQQLVNFISQRTA